MLFRVVAVAICTLAASVAAQPLQDPTQPVQSDPRVSPATPGGAKIPVTMPADPEVLDGERVGGTNTGSASFAGQVAVEEPVNPDAYACGTGDVFELEFWGQQNFRLKLAVDLEGRVFVSKVGFVTVAGKTLTAVRKAIKDKVRTNYPGLNFELTLVTPRTFLVHLVENVKQPGIYPARAVERLSTLLTRAGGITGLRGSKRRIQIRHRDGTTATGDLLRYELTGDTKYNPYLVDGDVVTVPFADVMCTIAGAVQRPGKYELVGSKDINELLELAGGLTSAIARNLPMRVIRRDADQHEVTEQFPLAATGIPNAPLGDDNQVLIPSMDEVRRTVLLIGAVVGAESIDAAATSRRLPYVDGDTTQVLIERAGGLKAPGDLKRSYISRPQPNGPPSIIPIDLEALLVRRDRTADVKIAMGDTIVIPPMQYSVMVEGAVARAGLYSYNPLFHVPEYLAYAGGRTRTAADLDDVRVVDAGGHSRPYKANTALHPGDAILVPERTWTRNEIAQLVIGGAGLVLSGIAVIYAVQR